MKPSISWLSYFGTLLLLDSARSQVVHLDQGSLRGATGKSRNGSSYFRFLGVPYAQPPQGELRFKAPQRHPGWTGEGSATSFGSDCPQRGMNFQPYGKEDCLYLNIYTPQINTSAKLPVMVHLHGGAFIMGRGNYFQEKFFMDRDIVLVTLNYRLGILGFMSFLDDIFPGNQGLRDQILALEWIQDNIDHFGGDPDRVTLFGGSAGAASVDYLVVSPLAKGLFHRAILQAGTSTTPWAHTPPPVAKRRAEAVATMLGCPTKPTSDTLSCLKELPMEAFVFAADKFLEWDTSPLGPFAPIIDSFLGNNTGVVAVVPDHPLALSPNPDVKIMLGFNSAEGNMIASAVCFNEFRLARQMQEDWPRRLTLLTTTQDQMRFDEKARLATMLTNFYLDGKSSINAESVQQLADMGTDLVFGHPAYKAALNYYPKVPVYFYLYDLEPLQSLISLYGNCSYLKGPSHGEEHQYFFNDIYPPITLTPEDHRLSHKLLDLWVEFATTGVPSQKWSPVTSDHIEYLHMTRAGFKMKRGLFEERMRFIDSLPLISNQYPLRHPETKTEL